MVCWMCSLNKDYSKLYDTLFLSSKREYQYDYSIEVDNEFVIDIDTNGLVVAVEMQFASDVLGLSRNKLNGDIDCRVFVNVTPDIIKVRVISEHISKCAEVKKGSIIERKTINNRHAKQGKYFI